MTLAEHEATFEPTETAIGPAATVAARTHADVRGLEEADTFIDATEGRSVFPMPSTPRRFGSERAYLQFLQRELGLPAGDTSGSYVMAGTPYWTDPATGVRYVVSDPIAAFVGGVDGRFEVGGETRCFDRDGTCAAGARASHLVPEGELTRPTHIYRSGTSGLQATWHSFFNWTPFPWPWARHGTNASINLAPLPNTAIELAGTYYYTISGYAGAYPENLGYAYNSGVSSLELAVWTAWPSGPVWSAVAVCGGGTISDVDLPVWDSNQLTGNGPQNNTYCGL